MPFAVAEFRLFPRGSAGIACDDDGVTIGSFPLVHAVVDGCCGRLVRVASDDEIQNALTLAYGDVPPLHRARIARALRSIAKALAEGKYALARITAVQMGLPEFPKRALAHLAAAAEILKYNTNWPSEARDERGRWTDSGAANGDVIPVIEPFTPECRAAIARAADICAQLFDEGKI